jgi:hypothetical protein
MVVQNREPLDLRTWTFQERYLSPRKLHFNRTEVCWECQTHYGFESEVIPEIYRSLYYDNIWQSSKLLPTKSGDAISYRGWADAVSRYSTRALTHASDKLPALAGLATFVGSKTEARYCAGLWTDDLPRGLLWYTANEGTRPKLWRAPTWSWACIDATIEYENMEEDQRVATPGVTVARVQIFASENNPFGAVTGG